MQRTPLVILGIALLLALVLVIAWRAGTSEPEVAPAAPQSPVIDSAAPGPLEATRFIQPPEYPVREDLAPEEPPAVDLVVPSLLSSRLRGRVLFEGERAPIADVPIWLLAHEEEPGQGARYFRSRDRESVLAHTRTDESGQFQITGVAPGRYWLGPAPRSDAEGRPEWFPLAQPVKIGPDGGDRQLLILVFRALYVGGKVLDEHGQPAEGILVLVDDGFRGQHQKTDSAGTFRLGPFSPGNCRVIHWRGVALSEGISDRLVNVLAGTEDLVLELDASGRMSGHVVDGATAELHPATIRYSRGENSFGGPGGEPSSRFDVRLGSGTYLVSAVADDARIALLFPVVVGPGAHVEDLELRFEPGGQMRVRYQGDVAAARYWVRWNGFAVATGELRPDAEALATAPAGEVDLELHIGGEVVEARRVSIVAGKVVEVEFER